jgi:hypothetical protein
MLRRNGNTKDQKMDSRQKTAKAIDKILKDNKTIIKIDTILASEDQKINDQLTSLLKEGKCKLISKLKIEKQNAVGTIHKKK